MPQKPEVEVTTASNVTTKSKRCIRPPKSLSQFDLSTGDEEDSTDKLIENSKVITVEAKPKKERKKYICNICHKQFLGSNDLKKHLRVHNDERPFECTQCTKKFRQDISLKNHVAAIHGTEKKFQCDQCNKAFPIKERLRLHMRVHSGEKPYSCPSCPKKFARNGQLRQHVVTHVGTKDFKCSQCPNTYSSPANLRLHTKTHLDEPNLKCHICNKVFHRPDVLRKHLLCLHGNVKAFYCNICNKTLKGHLPQHQRLHKRIKPHTCEICEAVFSQKSQLNVHRRMHSGERPYRCQVCWQAFAHSSVLKLHIRKHTGEKPFKCFLCKESGVAFSQLPHLKTHMRAIHGKDKSYVCEDCEEYFKTKNDLQIHKEHCQKSAVDENSNTNKNNANDESAQLSKLRLFVAILLNKISTEERLKTLGFEKRLIDNVLISALKAAGRKFCIDEELTDIARLRGNINELLEWTVPENFMNSFKEENKSVDDIIEKLAVGTYQSQQ